MKGCGLLSILVVFVTALAQPTLKIYVEAPDVPAAIQVLKSKCPVCSVVIKKDTADFVMILGADKFAVFENAQGQLLKDGSAGTTEDAVVACLDAIRAHAESKPAAQQNVTSGAKALIHVYRYKQFVGAAVEPSIYCNEVQVARMDNGRYFTMEVDPGKYVLRANDRQSAIELQAKSGITYYVRMELVTGFMKGHGRLILIQPEQGGVEIKKLQYLGSDKIKDRSLVKDRP